MQLALTSAKNNKLIYMNPVFKFDSDNSTSTASGSSEKSSINANVS